MEAGPRRVVALSIVLVLAAGCAGGTAPAPDAAEPTGTISAEPPVEGAPDVAPAAFTGGPLGEFDLERAMRHVRKLSNEIGVRVRGTRGEHLAKRYVRRKLRSYGYVAWTQTFAVDGRRSHNVVAKWPGSNDNPFVMGAHIDTVPASPGANDNASGTAVLLEMARIAAGRRQASWIRFVGFGAEEYGTDGRHHVGSTVYVERLGTEGRRKAPGMVSVDMVADGRPLLVGNSDIASGVVARWIYNRLVDAHINVDRITLCDCSDHGPFEHAGIPASFMYSGPEPDYHDPSDVPANLEPEDLERSGRAARVLVQNLDGELIRRFRRR